MLTVEKKNRVREISIVLNAYSRKEKRLQINYLSFYLNVAKNKVSPK